MLFNRNAEEEHNQPKCLTSENHSSWKDLRRCLTQPPAQAGSALMWEQVVQSFVKSCLQALQEWGPHSLTRQPVLIVDCSHREKDFPYIQSELLLFQLTPIACHPPAIPHCEEFGSIFLITSPRKLESCCQVPPNSSLFQANQVHLPQLLCKVCVSSWWLSAELAPIYISLVLRAQNWTTDVVYQVPRKGYSSTCFAINLQHSRGMGLVISQMKWLSVILCKPNGSQK